MKYEHVCGGAVIGRRAKGQLKLFDRPVMTGVLPGGGGRGGIDACGGASMYPSDIRALADHVNAAEAQAQNMRLCVTLPCVLCIGSKTCLPLMRLLL